MTEALLYPQTRTCPYQLPASYEPLRESPISRVTIATGASAWVVTGHAESRALLADPRVSADRRHPAFPVAGSAATAKVLPRVPFISMDEPEHGRYRRMLISDFTVRRFKELRPRIDQIVHETIDAMLDAGPPTDLVAGFALPIPSLVICELLGVPYQDHAFFQQASQKAIQLRGTDEAIQAFLGLNEYLAKLSADPPPGLIARLKQERVVASGEMDTLDLVITAQILLVAGHETTASMLGLGAFTLLEHPDQLAAMRENPALAVEELLRYLSIIDGPLARVALEDIEIGGVTIKAGEGVVFSTPTANRDPDAFPDPDVLDVTRTENHHVAFGFGVHQCLGQNLARMEMELALTALFDRIPTLRLAVPAGEVRMRPGDIAGLTELPVTW
jgi:pentalenic acid synthase